MGEADVKTDTKKSHSGEESRSLIQIIEQFELDTPDKIAVVSGDVKLTYRK